MEHRGSPRLSLAGRPSTWLRERVRRLGSLTTIIALTVSGLAIGTVVAPAASAAPGPVQTTTGGMVTAQALPTVQINGVVWSQAIVGNKVYAGGNFTYARPAGSAPGTNQVRRHHLLAYDLTTGNLDSFAPALNGQVRALTVSPDGKRLYVGGDFTTINGGTRNRIAVFNTADDTLMTGFLGSLDYSVYAIAATNNKVYVGGDFNVARGVARKKLAAFGPLDGALSAWNPGADGKVNALVMSPDNTRVIVGGAFGVLAGRTSYGHGAVSATSGAAGTWNANNMIRNYGPKAAITSLSTDGSFVYGSGYVYNGTGNFEGAFSADPKNGTLKWIEDCHGDTYGTWAPRNATNVMYTVSHAHYCGNVGGPPESAPTSYNRALAFTKSVTGTLRNNGDAAYANFAGAASPSVVNWFPQISMGSFTGQNQGSWTVTGNDEYVVIGGEFPRVNGVNQQGLVRFAVQPIAKGLKPLYGGRNLVPTIQSIGNGGIRATVTTNVDKDDSNLRYELVRDLQTVSSATANSTYWNRPKVTIADGGLTAGKTYSYQIRTVDSGGNATLGNPVSFKVGTTSPPGSTYSQLVANQGATSYWRFGDTGTVYDWAGTNDGIFGSGVTRRVAGAIVGDANRAATFNGTGNGRFNPKYSVAGPTIFSAQAWFNTTTKAGGKILGFGSSPTGASGTYDRHIYMDNAGKLYFGTYVNAVKTVASPKAYNDGKWHQVVGTLSRAGLMLYVDGVKVAQDTSVRDAQGYNGYWRVGGDNLAAWPGTVSSQYFKGTIDEVSIYPSALTGQQVKDQYAASGQSPAAAAALAADAPAEAAPPAVAAAPEEATTPDTDTGADAEPQARVLSDPETGGSATDPNVGAADPAAGPGQIATVAADTFERTVADGFGSADQGGDWAMSGSAADYDVGSGAGTITMAAGSDHSAFLDAVSPADVDATVDVRLDKVADADGTTVSLVGRHMGTSDYRLAVRVLADGTVTAQPTKLVDGVEAELVASTTIPGLTYAAGDTLRLRLAVSGTDTATVNGKVWKVGDTEPSTWSMSVADSSEPLTAGGVGVATALSVATTSPVVASFDNLAVQATR